MSGVNAAGCLLLSNSVITSPIVTSDDLNDFILPVVIRKSEEQSITIFFGGVFVNYDTLVKKLAEEKIFMTDQMVGNLTNDKIYTLRVRNKNAVEYLETVSYALGFTNCQLCTHLAQIVLVEQNNLDPILCHYSGSFPLKVNELRTLTKKLLEVVSTLSKFDTGDSLETKQVSCENFHISNLVETPDIIFHGICAYFGISNCQRLNLMYDNNMNCNDEFLRFFYYLNQFMQPAYIEYANDKLVNVHKRFGDVSFGVPADATSNIDTAVNVNSKNIEALKFNEHALFKTVDSIVAKLNEEFEDADGGNPKALNKLNLAKIVYSFHDQALLLQYKRTQAIQLTRLENIIDYTIYVVNKVLDSQINLIKNLALSVHTQTSCQLYIDDLSCVVDRPHLTVDKTLIQWQYTLEKLVPLQSRKFVCVPTAEGLSKKNGHYLLESSSDQKLSLMSDGSLIRGNVSDTAYSDYDPDSVDTLLCINDCFFNVFENNIIMSCKVKSNVRIVSGTVNTIEPYQLLELELSDFPIALNSHHIDYSQLVSNIVAKGYQSFYLNERKQSVVSPKGFQELIRRDQARRVIPLPSFVEVISNHPVMTHYFSWSIGIISFVVIITSIFCCVKYKEFFAKLWSFVFSVCKRRKTKHVMVYAKCNGECGVDTELLERNKEPSQPSAPNLDTALVPRVRIPPHL